MTRILRSAVGLAFVVLGSLAGIAATARGQAENSSAEQRPPSSEAGAFPVRNDSFSLAARLQPVKILTLQANMNSQLPGYLLAVYAEDDTQAILDAAEKYNAEIEPYKERASPLLKQLHDLEQAGAPAAEISAVRQKLQEVKRPHFDPLRGSLSSPYRVVTRGRDYLELEPLLDPEYTKLIPYSQIVAVTFFKPGQSATKKE
jgi:hypothetical protein